MLKKILPPRLVPFLHFLAPYKKLMALGILSLLATDALTMVIPWLLKTVIDLLPGKPSGEVLARYAGWLILTALGLGVGRYGWRQYFFGSSRRIEVDIQNRLFSHLLDLDAVYFQSQRTGDLMSRATNDLRAVRDFLGLGLLILVDAVAVMAASISLMFYIQPKLAFFCLLPLPLVSVIFLKFLKASGLRHKAIQESLARITHRVQENLAGIRILHAFVQEEHEKRRFDTLNREHIRENLALAGIFGLFTASLSFTMGVVAMISLWLGGKAVIAGSMTLGAFVAFNGYLMLLAWPMMAVGYIINLTQKGLTAMERLQEIFQARSSLKPVGGTASSMVLRGGLEFENAGFHYDGAAEAALHDVSFCIEPGQRVALIGMVGAGKSTLMRLILRLHEVSRGSIRLDGHSIDDIPLAVLRRDVGYVDQAPFLFSATVRDNIALSRPETGEDEIRELVDCVSLTADVETWPKGLDTLVGERGVSLSGGQKQRVALARALLKRPRLLLLDDAFSSLDVETEQVILKNIHSRLQGITTLLSTHRLAMARGADSIFVLQRGRLVESGTHAELMRRHGHYHRVFTLQALAREMEITLQ